MEKLSLTPLPIQAPFSLLLLDIAAHKGAGGNDNVAVVGALTFEYSTDGAVTFNSSLAPLGAGQCIRNIADTPGAFAAVGTWGLLTETNGPAVSYDAGAVFTAINITELQTEGRYGAFPTKSTWFITAGDWPSDDNANAFSYTKAGARVDPSNYVEQIALGATLVKRRASRVHLLQEPGGALKWATVKRGRLHAANGGGEYQAQIAKTSDSGKTWSVVFSDFGEYYFNGIECATDMDCCAVAEDEGPPMNNATDAGAYVFCTTDGGATWTENLHDLKTGASLIDIAAFSPQEYWAVGGQFGAVSSQYPFFFHTTDAGATWTNGSFSLDMLTQYAIDITCVPGVNCWANLLNAITQESSLAVLNNHNNATMA
jgi:hypothetical protein